jgi:hypothetical protein
LRSTERLYGPSAEFWFRLADLGRDHEGGVGDVPYRLSHGRREMGGPLLEELLGHRLRRLQVVGPAGPEGLQGLGDP